jgi:hypothetical protein
VVVLIRFVTGNDGCCKVTEAGAKEDRMFDERADVLRFWRAVELFNPQAVPEISPYKYV